jgi:hypothetical protein
LNYLTRKDFTFNFDEKCKAFFEELKDRFCIVPIFHYYDPELECMLKTDVSNGIIVAVLSQFHPDGEWYPVGYFSKTIGFAKLNYPIYDKEMLAIIRVLRQWRAELSGIFTVIKVLTDYRFLEYFMNSKILNSR